MSGNVGDGTGTRTAGEEPRSAVGTAADVVAAFRIRCFVSAMSRHGAVLASERTTTTGPVDVCAERKLAQCYNGYNEWTHGLNAHAIRKITEQATEAPGRVEAGVMHEHTGSGRRMQGAFGLLPLRASAGVPPGFPPSHEHAVTSISMYAAAAPPGHGTAPQGLCYVRGDTDRFKRKVVTSAATAMEHGITVRLNIAVGSP